MFHRPSTGQGAHAARRGQALVEFALILPLLVLLLLMALDFGRVFFGWVALHNAARIGADHAAANADSWVGVPDPIEQGRRDNYEQLVLNDLESINCDPDPDGDGDAVPDPVFRNADGSTTGDVTEDGDHAVVTLDCEFGLLTPLAETILGGPVALRAEGIFAINRGGTLGLPSAIPLPEPSPPASGGCSALAAAFDTTPAAESNGRVEGNSPLTVTFTDTSTTDASCPIESWSWDFDDDGSTVDSTDPNPSHAFTHPGGGGPETYDVTLTVTTSEGSDTASITVRVRP